MIGSSEQYRKNGFFLVKSLLAFLGFLISHYKSAVTPSKEMEFEFRHTPERSSPSTMIKERSKTDSRTRVVLSDLAIVDLKWWESNLESLKGKPLSLVDPDIIIFSACITVTGWRGCCNAVRARGL